MATKLFNLANQVYYTSWACLCRRDLLRPTYIIDNFNELKIPGNTKLVVLDKDNCFAKPHALEVLPDFQKRWDELLALDKKQYDVVVLSNTAGDTAADGDGKLMKKLEQNIGAEVIRHNEKKPMCFNELRSMYRYEPQDILIVGDRLATDVLLANLMGAQSVWIRPGLHPSIFNRIEMYLYRD